MGFNRFGIRYQGNHFGISYSASGYTSDGRPLHTRGAQPPVSTTFGNAQVPELDLIDIAAQLAVASRIPNNEATVTALSEQFANRANQLTRSDGRIHMPEIGQGVNATYRTDDGVRVNMPPQGTPAEYAASLLGQLNASAASIAAVNTAINPNAAAASAAAATEIAASPERTALLNEMVRAYDVKGADGAALPADATDAQKITAIETALAGRNIAGITGDGKLTRGEVIAASKTLFNNDGTPKAEADAALVRATAAILTQAAITKEELGFTALPAAPAPAAPTVTIPEISVGSGAAARRYGLAEDVPVPNQNQVNDLQNILGAVVGKDRMPKTFRNADGRPDGMWGLECQNAFHIVCQAMGKTDQEVMRDITATPPGALAATFRQQAQTMADARAAAAQQPAAQQPAAQQPAAQQPEAQQPAAQQPAAAALVAETPAVEQLPDVVTVTGRDDLLITINGSNYNFGRANLNHLTPEGRNSLHQMAEIGLKAMNGYGWDSGIQDTDGRSGVRSEAAIRRFQEAHGLSATGVADVRTVRQIGQAVTEHQLAQELKTQGVDAAATFAPSLNNISINPFVTALVADMRFSSIPAAELASMTATQKIERAFSGNISGIKEDGILTNAEATLIGRQLEQEARSDRAAGREAPATQRDVHQAFAGMMQQGDISRQNYGVQNADLSSVGHQPTPAGAVTQQGQGQGMA